MKSTAHNGAFSASSPIYNHSHREWVSVKNAPQNILTKYRFKMASFNMLNQSYMWPQVYDSYVAPLYRSWDYRVKLLSNIVNHESVRSDIMCFQEMETQVYYNYWRPMFNDMGFGSEFIRKTKPVYWEKESENIDGVSIFFNRDKFELIECKKFQISHYFKNEFNNLYNINFDKKVINETFETRNQVCLIMALRHKATQEVVLVANTHLYWKFDDIKLLQTLVVLEALNKFEIKYPGAKTLFSGDFNSKPTSSVYQFLKNNEIPSNNSDIAKYLQKDGINSSSRALRTPVPLSRNVFDEIIQEQGLFTCYTKHLFGIFDYIWFNSSDFHLLKFLSGVDQDYLQSIEGLPNKDYPSDHIPIVAEFAIRSSHRL